MRDPHAFRFLKPMTFVRIRDPHPASIVVLLPEMFAYFPPLVSTFLFINGLVLALFPKGHRTCKLKASAGKGGLPFIIFALKGGGGLPKKQSE